MNQDACEQALLDSLEDLHLSRRERRDLKHLLREDELTRQDRAWMRDRAFELADGRLNGDGEADGVLPTTEVLEWLREVMKLLTSKELNRPAPPAPRPSTTQTRFSPGNGPLEMIRDQLRRARQAIDICVFTITDDRISGEILRAHRRGVAVRIVSDDDKSLDKGSDIDRLSRRGVPVAVDDSPAHLHHKFALFDRRRLLMGSYNWTRSAATQNSENVVLLDEAVLLTSFQAEFDRLWERFS
ncbi:MAG: phospholipase D-like domain-containing protein [Acidobacteriota bacterium]